MQPLSFQPEKREFDAVPLETHNAVLEELAQAQNELQRCRQKVAHLLREQTADNKEPG